MGDKDLKRMFDLMQKKNERCWKTKLANEQILFFNSIVTKTSF